MAVRPQHMHDGGIVERRLRPIYDWLDNGNNKKALQEAEKVLKKSPSLQAARALKALALFRLGKGTEAHQVLDALAEEKPSDDNTLQAMTISYRESQQLHKVCALYENAVKSEPASEELHSHLFMSYVRVGDYRAQQRAAMALFKFAPKNPYYFWAVMSIILQAKTSEDNTKRGILLSLAQRMVDNFISENKMEAEQEARLYIMILELQEKWEDILKFIEGPLYSQLVPGSTAQASIPYLKKLGQWKRLNLVCKELLWDNQDRWDYYVPYFDSVFQLMKDNDDSSENSVDNTAEKCHEFICQLVESMTSGRTLRGPYLARLELWKRLSVDGDPTSILGSGLALCVQYLRVFANKPCAVPDLRPYLGMIPQKEREENCRDFLTCLGFDEKSEPDLADDIQRHISCLSIWRMVAAPLPADGALALAATLKGHYLRCLHRGLVTSNITEFCAVDSYGILAAHHYFYAGMLQQSSAPAVEALCLLELVLHHSPANFHAKLLLVKLYHVLGNALAADSIYQRLEVKHIQLVSIGWLHCARLAPACAASRALQLLADTRAFLKHHGKDSVEHLTYAYKYGTFEKLVELGAWGARLEACGWGAAAARDQALLHQLAGPPALLHQPSRLPAQPADNRDLNVIVNFEPPQFQDEQLKSRTFDQEVSYLRLKDALVSAIALCIELADSRPVEEKKQHYEQLNACVDAFSAAMDKCRQMYAEKERISISAPFPSRIIAFVNSPVPYRELYGTALRLVGELAAGHTRAAQDLSTAAARMLPRALIELSAELAVKGDPVWCMRDRLETLSNYLEFVGIITFLLGVCNELFAPTNTKKSKKKTNQSPDELKTSELLNKLNETVQDSISFLENILDGWPQYELPNDLEQTLANLSIDNKYQSPVESKLKNGRDDMINDVRNILKRKSKYLKSLLQ
ncbi:phagocyte signaling-impaired protein [Trichoplusia ni]|uniref:N-terminal acetyltransferase B complex subunit MDM20 homolog n=1 Tax=Trichoplusia ni TaxID=7111 RepID=A0A7E5WIA1_TRINI|nr:phagocyte signaling-impaired protein [Trichoplusia ni]